MFGLGWDCASRPAAARRRGPRRRRRSASRPALASRLAGGVPDPTVNAVLSGRVAPGVVAGLAGAGTSRRWQLLAVSASGAHDDARLGPRPRAADCGQERLAGGSWAESTVSGSDRQGERTGGDWRPQRIGPVPSPYSVSARRDVERLILAASEPGQSDETAGGA